MIILGISALYHDSAACLIIDGEIIAAAQEERFTRKKHDLAIPIHAIDYCMEEGKIKPADIEVVVFYDNPFLTIDRFVHNVLAAGSDSRELVERSFTSLFAEKLWVHKYIDNILGENTDRKFYVCEHHISHAASAYYPSPFTEAVILTIDGVGEWTTLAISLGIEEKIEIKEEIKFPHSLGLFYSAFTYFCGFKVNSGDYKFMGLAPYGEAKYVDLIKKEIIDIKEDGSFRLNMDYFDYQYGRTMTNRKMEQLFGGARRQPETDITKREMDIAASVQKVTEEILLKLVAYAKETYGTDINNLVMAGGVALNCVANGKIKNSNIFENIWIQPAAGDAGGSLGAALYYAYNKTGMKRAVSEQDFQNGSYLGPAYSNDEIVAFLQKNGYEYQLLENDNLYECIADNLANGKVIGLFHGRMEFGPRALGNRSIIADARSEEMQVKLNKKIKFRESFRPFAPSVLLEDVGEYFDLQGESPYMLLVENVRENRRNSFELQDDLSKYNNNMLEIVRQRRSDIPAVTHVDYSARIQTVSSETNPYYYNLLKCFKKHTGYGVIVNTSFNVRGEPIVCTPQNAYDCFMRTDMDVLVLENCVLYKEKQPKWTETEADWKSRYALD